MSARLTLACAVAIALPLLAGGCMRAQARVNPELPPLDVPAPPPRNVEATEPPQPLPATAVQEPSTTAPSLRPATQPQAPQRPEPARPEPARVEAPPPSPEPAKPAEDDRGLPAATLQTTPAGREAEVERGILDTLARASASLNRIDYRALNAEARVQYDSALGFIRQSRDALRERNLVFAETLAGKAQTIAVQLAGR